MSSFACNLPPIGALLGAVCKNLAILLYRRFLAVGVLHCIAGALACTCIAVRDLYCAPPSVMVLVDNQCCFIAQLCSASSAACALSGTGRIAGLLTICCSSALQSSLCCAIHRQVKLMRFGSSRGVRWEPCNAVFELRLGPAFHCYHVPIAQGDGTHNLPGR